MGNVIKINNDDVIRLYIDNPYNKIAKIIYNQFEHQKISDSPALELDIKIKNLFIKPNNICFLASVNQDDIILFSTLLTTNDALGFYYNDLENDITTIKLTTPEEVSLYFQDLLSISQVNETGTSLMLSSQGLLTLTTLIDGIKRKYLEQLIFHIVDGYDLTILEVEEIFEISYNSEDIRWYLPFFAEAFGPFEQQPLDNKAIINEGLKELENIGLLKIENDKIEFTREGFAFLSVLLQKRNLLMLRSLFYEQDILNQLPIAFLSFDNIVYYIMPIGDKYSLKSIDKDTFSELIEMIIAPGEEPKVAEEKVTPIKPSTKFCKYCGSKLKSNANFCNSCGKSLLSNK